MGQLVPHTLKIDLRNEESLAARDGFCHRRASGVPHLAPSFPQQAGNPDQDHRTDERHDDRTDRAAIVPDPQHSEDPAAEKPREDTEDDVHQHAVGVPLHNLTGEPTRQVKY